MSSEDGIRRIQIPKAFQDLFKPKRYKTYYGGRGSGKSQSFALALLVKTYNEQLRVLCAREYQTSISDSVHKLLSDMIEEYDLGGVFDVTQTAIRNKFNGSEFIFKGLKHNATEIKSTQGVDICWVEEAEKVSDNSWELLIPTIRKPNSEIWVSFNNKQPTDPTYVRMVQRADPETSIVRKVSWRDNPFFPEVLDQERRKLEKDDPEAYAHIWEGEFDTRYSGAVYAKWIKPERVSKLVSHDPLYPVYTAWDLGYDDATAIWFYQIGAGEIFFIDYYENQIEDIIHYCEVMYGRKIVVRERDARTGAVTDWHFGEELPDHAHRQQYTYHHVHFVPHDAAYKVQAAGGRDIIRQAKEVGIKMMSFPAVSFSAASAAMRVTLPKAWFNEERCRDGVRALLSYHYKYDEERKMFRDKPHHDWSSHAADACELAARVWREKGETLEDVKRRHDRDEFFRLREEIGIDSEDPYRIRSKHGKGA